MGHEFRKPELPLCQVLVLVLISMLSCGHDRGTDLSAPVGQSNSGIMNDQSGYGAIEQIQPGIHESSAFFPVEPDAVPSGFVVVGDMGGPVLYSSSTVPAWLVGHTAYLLGPDGSLSTVALEESSNVYLPPDLAVFARHKSSRDPLNPDSQDLDSEDPGSALYPDDHAGHYPLSISVTGPASAVYILDDYRLLDLRDGTPTVLRQFSTEFAGIVAVSASPMEIVIADSYGRIMALDGTGGRIFWESVGGPVLLSGGLAIFCGADTRLQIIEAIDGRIAAKSDLAGFSGFIKPTRDATSIFAVLENGNLVAMDHYGKTRWIAETGMQSFRIMNDLEQVYAVSTDMLVAFDKVRGAEQWRLSMPVPPAADPVILPGSIVFAGTDGRVYASVPDSISPAPRAVDPGERISAIIGFRLEKYVRNPTGQLATFMPYVDQVAHEGPRAFTVFAFGPVELGGEYWLTWKGQDRDVVLALFDEHGSELRANLDEFGAHDTFSYRLDEGGLYFIALGRQDPSVDDEPLFLSVIPSRQN